MPITAWPALSFAMSCSGGLPTSSTMSPIRQQFLMAGDAGTGVGVGMVEEERGVTRALLDQHVETYLREPMYRVGHKCHAPLAWRALLDDSYLHLRDLNDHVGTTGRL